MAKNVEHVSHIKSKLKTNGLPQLPTADKLVDGEIAINYAEGVETISIRNENSAITTFSSDNYYTEKKLGSGFTNNDATVTEAIDDLEYMVVNKEEAIAAALNDINGRKLDASAYTPTDLSNYYTKSETSGATEIYDLVGSGFTSSSITDVIIENEEITSNALNELSSRKLDASAYTPTDLSNYYTTAQTSGATELQTAFNGKTDTATTTALNDVVTAHTANTNIHLTTTEKGQLHTHTNKTYLDSITGTVGTMVYENASSYSSATQVNTALAGKSDTGHTHVSSGVTAMTGYAKAASGSSIATSDTLNQAIGKLEAYVDDLNSQSETVAAALVDLYNKIGDIETLLSQI